MIIDVFVGRLKSPRLILEQLFDNSAARKIEKTIDCAAGGKTGGQAPTLRSFSNPLFRPFPSESMVTGILANPPIFVAREFTVAVVIYPILYANSDTQAHSIS